MWQSYSAGDNSCGNFPVLLKMKASNILISTSIDNFESFKKKYSWNSDCSGFRLQRRNKKPRLISHAQQSSVKAISMIKMWCDAWRLWICVSHGTWFPSSGQTPESGALQGNRTKNDDRKFGAESRGCLQLVMLREDNFFISFKRTLPFLTFRSTISLAFKTLWYLLHGGIVMQQKDHF